LTSIDDSPARPLLSTHGCDVARGHQRGNIAERGGALRVRLYAGTDPVTRRQVYLRTTISGTDKDRVPQG
jgi:hypothetical protein